MKKFGAVLIAALFVIAVSVVALPMIFIAANSSSASVCSSSIPTGEVVLSSGSASDAYFNTPNLGKVAERLANAKEIVAIGNQRKETAYSIQTALEASLQESGLLNLTSGLGTRLGLFQLEPGDKWGTPTDILNVANAANEFFDALDKVTDKDKISHKDAAIAVLSPSIVVYQSWHWDDIGNDLVGGTARKEKECEVHLPLDPGFHVSYGGGFADLRYVGTSPHIGIDLVYASNTRGRPVYSAFNGVVISSGIGRGCRAGAAGDNVTMILTPDGLKVGYLHMNGDDILVHVGDTVTAGERIGAIGGCGEATGPHLHFEVTPGSDKDSWLGSIRTVHKYGLEWLDPVAIMAHYGVKLIP